VRFRMLKASTANVMLGSFSLKSSAKDEFFAEAAGPRILLAKRLPSRLENGVSIRASLQSSSVYASALERSR
jgi:hypothetical protein